MPSVLQEKTYLFAVRIVKMCQAFNGQRDTILREKVLRSGTAIGQLATEAVHAHTNTEFIYKLNISVKEVNETKYWLRLLKDTDMISLEVFETMERDLKEILRMLVSSIKTAKANQN